MKKAQFRTRKNSGFSLGELLITVAVLVALMAVSLPSVLQIQKNLRQKELDAKAEIIYAAAQNAISKLKAGGKTAVYQCAEGGGNGVWKTPEIPEGAETDEDNFCYFTSAELSDPNSAASKIMNCGTIDESLLNQHWVVEYDLSSATIYAVFYSEDLVNCAGGSEGYKENFGKYNLMRPREARLADGAKVGYYGGGSASSSTVTTMAPTLAITNVEKLTADISCVLPISVSDYPVFKVDLKDGSGHTYTKYYAYFNCGEAYKQQIEHTAGGHEINYTLMNRIGRAFKLELILDDLSSESTRFVNAYGTGSSHSVQLEAGTALTVTVTAMCPGNYKYTQNLSATAITNSLFADGSTGDTAVISYARHLQNLDASSGVVETITKAEQRSDITFTDEAPAVSSNQYIDWFETYHAGYFNGITAGVPNFKPIQNSKLRSYDGGLRSIAKLTAEAGSDAGLFATLGSGQTVSNIVLTGTDVRSMSAAAGALVGNVTGDATIKQCQVYLTTPDIMGKDNHDVWIRGKNVGGLIGTVTGGTVSVEKSAASTVVGGHTYNAGAAEFEKVSNFYSISAGGLIGSVAGGSVTIRESYADCYLFGKTVGGLVGTSSGGVNVSACYAAGFETFETEGAGLVCGGATMRDSYTIVYPIDTDNIKPYYRTAKTGSAENVYYLADLNSGADTLGTAIGEMTADSLPGSSFIRDNTTVRPYNLMGQALSAYPYPVLKVIKQHYGDWMADFQEGTLVYYEEYNDGTYGFFGASVQSTLKDDASRTVVGDGYGIVYQKGAGNLPAQVTVTVKNGTSVIGTETLQISGVSPFEVTGVDGSKQYNIYPFSKVLVNVDQASDKYYLKAEIRSETQTDAYYFNPHFAMTQVGPLTDANAPVPDLTPDHHIMVRTPRHLYMLSLYYDTYAAATAKCTFLQERNIDYARYKWDTYFTKKGDQIRQAPIAGNNTAFRATYDGGCHWITNVNFATENGLYVGFIGQNAGTVKDVVLTATYEEGSADNYYVRRSGNIENNSEIYIGVLVGRNFGTIQNCAVSGYYIAGSDGTIHAYENSNLYAGGLVGGNAGTITNCSADTPALRLSSSYANAYLGGFAGINSNYISNCYALGHIEVAFAKGGRVSIAGFAGRNTAIVRESYCATALTASGEVTAVYGFAPVGGQVNDCDYLNNGTYAYINHMYPFNFEQCAGTSATFSELKTGSAGNQAVNSYNFQNTKTDIAQYPFRAVVRDDSGDLVHYGDWLNDENMGSVGVFYWEREEKGSNNGYHFTYLGTDGTGETAQMMGGTTLCSAHDDGGVITEYGYGYFELNKGSVTELQLKDAKIKTKTALTSGEMKAYYNQDASEALAKQMHKTLADGSVASYNFYAFTTGKDGLLLSGAEPDCTWTLIHKNTGDEIKKYTYTISPFFANAMSGAEAEVVTAFDGTVTDYSKEPGIGEDNQYEIRSIQQLQYINWNYGENNTSTLVNSSTYKQFTYLMYADKKIGTNEKVTKKEDIAVGDVMYWRQTHDVDATGFEGYTPIAGNYTSSSSESYNAMLYAWFGGNYNGESYKIQNLAINSKSFAVGLFGVTVGADIKNIIMYSNDDNVKIERSSDNKEGAYSLGGLIGVAYDYNVNKTDKTIKNCAIAGYQIVDNSTNQQGLGEANIGGLIGVSRVHLKNCSAVTNILLNSKPEKSAKWGVFIRVGGLTGAAQGSVLNCYSGGSANVSDDALNHIPYYIDKTKYEIYIGGIMGSAFTSNYQNFNGTSGATDGSPTIENCYTYFTFPAVHSRIKAMYPIASAADRANETSANTTVTIKNCYYFDSVITPGVTATYGPKTSVITSTGTSITAPTSVTYTQMSDGTLLGALGGIFEGGKPATGSVTVENAGYHNVTTTEGSANVSINGKYSFPGSNYALEGKDYPFPAVVQQKDLTFSTAEKPVYAYVHYGDWPIDGPYWARGRDTMDIFADMQTTGADAGWAMKTFYLNPNGKPMDKPTIGSFTCTPSAPNGIVEVMAVGEKDSNGLYPVTIKGLNTGTAVITFTTKIEEVTYTASFSLEVTSEINVKFKTEPAPFKLRKDGSGIVTLSAESFADEAHRVIDYSKKPSTVWEVKTAEDGKQDLVLLEPQDQNVWKVTRDDLGKLTLKADFQYEYHGVTITKPVYIDVLQPDTVGLSGGGTQYSMAYLGTDTEGSAVTYGTNPPTMEDRNFFLYLDADTLRIEDLMIKSVSAVGQTETDTVCGTEKFHIEWDTPTSDKNYQYRPGSIYVLGDEDAYGVQLKVTVTENAPDATPCTLSITLPVVKKALTITYQNGLDAGAQSFTKKVSVGNHELPTQAECVGFTIPAGKMLEGWKIVNADHTVSETIYQAGDVYSFTEDVTFTAAWKEVAVTLYANGGTFDDDTRVKEILPDEAGKVTLSPTLTRSDHAFAGWNTKVDGKGTAYGKDVTVDISELAPEYALYAQWKPYTLTLINDGDPAEFKNVNGTRLAEYNSNDFVRAGYELDGWYTTTETDENEKPTGQKVLNASGKVVMDVDGYSKNGELALIGNQKLYACWKRPERFVLTDMLKDGCDYLLVSTNKPDEPEEISVAFGQEAVVKNNRTETQKLQIKVPVTVQKDAFEKIYIADPMPSYSVFRTSQANGSEGYYLKNSLGYLNVNRDNNNPGANSQYTFDDKKASTAWIYFGNNQNAGQTYNQNVLTDKNAGDWQIDPTTNLSNIKNTRRFTYSGRRLFLGLPWGLDGFTVKASKDEYTDMYIYEKQNAGYEFSTEAVPGSVMVASYSARTVATAESAALTLASGTQTVLSTAVPDGAEQVNGYTAPTRVNSEWTLEGWYTAKDGTGTKILNADGTATGETDLSGLGLSGDTTLYACWTRETDVFVQTETLEPDTDYLLVLGSGEETRTVGQVGKTMVEQPVAVYGPGDGSYNICDTETGERLPIDRPYITTFSDQTVWRYSVDDEGNGMLTAVDGSSRESALWGLVDRDISAYRRTAVCERTFEDEYLMLTLCTGTECITEAVIITDGAWTDVWSTLFQKLGLETAGPLGWFDSPDGGNAVLDAEGRFAAENVADYVKDGRWVYDGGSLTLYARAPEPPETVPMEAMFLPPETEEDKRKRTPHKVRLDDVNA